MHVANAPTCGPLLILSPALIRWGPPKWQGYVATWPTCGPPLILHPAVKCWAPPKRHGCAQLRATSDFVLGSVALGTAPYGKGDAAN